MFARPSYLRLSDSGEVMTTQRTSGASADLNGADASLGGEVREPFARDLAGEGGALRRLGLMRDSLIAAFNMKHCPTLIQDLHGIRIYTRTQKWRPLPPAWLDAHFVTSLSTFTPHWASVTFDVGEGVLIF